MDKGILIQSITEDDTVVMDANTLAFPLGSNTNKISFEAAVSLSQGRRRRRRILVGFDIYCGAATCGLVSHSKNGG